MGRTERTLLRKCLFGHHGKVEGIVLGAEKGAVWTWAGSRIEGEMNGGSCGPMGSQGREWGDLSFVLALSLRLVCGDSHGGVECGIQGTWQTVAVAWLPLDCSQPTLNPLSVLHLMPWALPLSSLNPHNNLMRGCPDFPFDT